MGIPTQNISIVLDRERTIRIDLNALARFEEVTGESALDTDVWNNMNARRLRAILWASLLHEDATLKLDQVGAMIHGGNMKEVSAQINKAFIASIPDRKDDDGEGGEKNVENPTG